jgi:hypothetical protein
MNKDKEYNYIVRFYFAYEVTPEQMAEYKRSNEYKKFKEAFPKEAENPENIAGSIAGELFEDDLSDGHCKCVDDFNVSIKKTKINED